MNGSLILNNPTRRIGRVRKESKDFSLFDPRGTNERIRIDLESSSIVTTLQTTRTDEIEKIMNEREPLIEERNKILDHPIKYFFYRKKLREIDAQLDELDLQLYLLDDENSMKKSDLDKIVSNAEARLEKYSKYLSIK